MVRRSLSGPLLVSIALHAVACVVLVALWRDPPDLSATHVLRVALQPADFIEVDGAPDAGAPQRAAAETGPNTEEAIESPAAALPARTAAETQTAAAAANPPPKPADPTPPQPTRELPPDPAADALTVHNSDALLAPARVAVPDVVAAAGEVPRVPQTPPARTAPISDAQQHMLDARVATWAAQSQAAAPHSVEWEHEGQQYTASFTRLPAGDPMGHDEVVVEIRTEAHGTAMSTELRMRRKAFSHFAKFIDRWDPSVEMHDDVVEGRFHANSNIYISPSRRAQPQFSGAVTTARDVNPGRSRLGRAARERIFPGGIETRAGRIGLPGRVAPALSEELAGRTDTLVVDTDTRIVFDADGSLRWQPVAAGGAGTRVRLPDGPYFVVGTARATLHVSGQVRGKVLVYSPHRIVIEGALLYASGDPVHDTPDDYLGLVSEGNVEIAAPATTGPGDLTIHGSILALRRFVVRRHGARGGAMLAIHGSLTAGSVSATEPRYRTRVVFDPRFEHARPPGFPATDRYALADRDAQWTVHTGGDASATVAGAGRQR